MNGKTVIVSQVRSSSGRNPSVIRTLEALGLGRIGKTKQHTINDAVYGMLRRVRHLVRVIEA
jgi:large subunit ribosomal protein L30